jgi:hypothetical protein
MKIRKHWLTKKYRKRREEITIIAGEGVRGSKKVKTTKKMAWIRLLRISSHMNAMRLTL